MRDSFLRVEAEGFAPSQLERVYLPPPSYDTGPIVVYPPVELRGRVTTAEGQPVEGAEIHAALGRALAPYGDHAHRAPIAVTNARGESACRALPPGLVTLGASAPGHADKMLEPREFSAEKSNRADFVVAPERIVRLQAIAHAGPLTSAVAEPLGDLWGEPPYSEQRSYRAFWRGVELADKDGRITLRGLDAGFDGDVVVTAPEHRPELVSLLEDQATVELQPVTWIEVVASRADGGPAPEIYQLIVRDTTRAPSWCGNCDDSRLAKMWQDSAGIQRLALERWRIAWNSSGCYVDGGPPGTVSAVSSQATRASADLPGSIEPGSRVECRLEFEAPARLSGIVRATTGEPVSLRLGVQLSFYRSDWLSTVSGADGRFEFERIGSGPRWLYSLDDHWRVDDACDRVELVSGGSLSDVVVTVHRQPDGRTGRAMGLVRIGGRAPSEPVLLALDEVPNQHLPSAYPRGLAWTDAQGRFEIGSFWPREYHILPKHRAPSPGGGWRDFAAEFPAHDSRWKWTVDIPEAGSTEVEIDLPPESEWDRVAPPKAKSHD
jgi:hypothetical protein